VWRRATRLGCVLALTEKRSQRWGIRKTMTNEADIPISEVRGQSVWTRAAGRAPTEKRSQDLGVKTKSTLGYEDQC
jgi:hypothetical protein